jgi:hypothetical protein
VAYQNDNYRVPPPERNPPPIPVPQTYGQAEQWITKSAFYSQTTPVPVRCDSQPINVSTASDAQLKSHFEGLMECLVRVWEPPITNAGFTIVRPTVTIYGEELTTKCGKSGVNAFYCSADQQVYYSNLLPEALPTVRRNKWTADIVMAHEFGHALQGRTGILISAAALVKTLATRALNCNTRDGLKLRPIVSPVCSCARSRNPLEWNSKISTAFCKSTSPLATTNSRAILTLWETMAWADHANTGETPV